MAEAEGLTKRFGSSVAVSDVTLEVPPGAIYGFIGPSGSGKTTTVRLLLGILAPTAGTVRVFGRSPAAFSARQRARIGYLPQLSALYPNLTIAANLKFVASLYGVGWLRRRRRIVEVLDAVDLGGERRKLLREASGGMQKRAALAATLLHEPELLFLDEPTAGIDPVLRRKLWDRFRALRDDGRTLFVTTQYVGEAAYCDRIAVLSEGRLLTVDTPEGLRRGAFGGEVLELVAAEPLGDPDLADLLTRPGVRTVDRFGSDGRGVHVVVEDAEAAGTVLRRWSADRDVRLERLEDHVPSFDDVFVKVVEGARERQRDG